MNVVEMAGLFVSATTFITALSALIVGVRNAKKLTDVHIDLNGRLSQLLKTSGAEQKAIGVQEERDRKN